MNRIGMRISVAAITTVLLLGSLSGCGKKENNETSQNTEGKTYVEVELAKKSTIEVDKELSGKVRPEKEIMIVPKIPGKVEKIYVKVGDRVKKNKLLVALDGTDVNLQVAQAEAGYNVASESVKLSKEKLDTLEEQKNNLEKASTELENAINKTNTNLNIALEDTPNKEAVLASIDMIRQSYITGDIEVQELTSLIQQLGLDDQVNSSLEELGIDQEFIGLVVGGAEMEKQLNTLNQSKVGIENAINSLPFNEGTLKAQQEQAKAGLNMAKNTQSGLKLTSPIEGVVSSITVTEGGIAAQNMPPITVIDIDNVILDVNLNEYEAVKVKKGENVEVYIDALGESFNGVVDYVSPAIDQRTQGFSTRIKIDNSNGNIKAGMFARAKIILDSNTDAIVISKESIVRENDKYYVYVVNEGKAIKKEITIGIDNGEQVEILKGIAKDDQVVTRGQEYLKDGAEIEVVRGDDK